MLKKSINIIILAVLLTCECVCAQTKDVKKEMIISLVRSSQYINEYASIHKVIKERYPDIWLSLPIGSPIKEKYSISSPFGYRIHPIDRVRKLHSGIDMKAEFATRIYAVASGKITFSGKKGGYGNCVIINHNNGYSTLYGHLSYIYKQAGETVTISSIIGFLGDTGKATGDHLHYEIRKNNKVLDPYAFLQIER